MEQPTQSTTTSSLFEHVGPCGYIWTVFLYKDTIMIQVSGGDGSYGRLPNEGRLPWNTWPVFESRRRLNPVPAIVYEKAREEAGRASK